MIKIFIHLLHDKLHDEELTTCTRFSNMKVPNGKKKTLNQSNNMSINFAATKRGPKAQEQDSSKF